MAGTAKARVAKFCMHVEYIKCWPWDDILSPQGRRQCHVTRLFILAPIISLESMKIGISNCVN